MNRLKTLSFPIISAIFASSGMALHGQVVMEVSSQATYRQFEGGSAMSFTGGSFNINFRDGSVVSIGGCDFVQYYPPAFFRGICSPGTTGFLTSGTINGATLAYPYLLVTAINPAVAVAPREARRVTLNAAPASELPRPSGGFTDNSATLYFNLHIPGNIQEYILTRYSALRSYDKRQLSTFKNQIVPGNYYYSFPRLNNPILPAPITAVIYPMVEGFAKINNKEEGFKFTDVNGSDFNKDGFVELSYIRPNIIKWNPLGRSTVLLGADSLYFSIKVIADNDDPRSAVVPKDRYSGKQQAIFPAFTNEGDPRVLLATPLVSQFTTPPVFAGGTKGVVEVLLGRSLQTGGVTYDYSSRKFQIPVVVVNRYSEYQDLIIGGGNNSGILDDFDKDGFNNLNEWILDSSANDVESTPVPPTTETVAAVYDIDYFTLTGRFRIVRDQYFGFTINEKRGTKPGVVYTLQRSRDKGKTWQRFVSDADWSVTRVSLAPGVGSVKANTPKRVEIRVESKYNTAGSLITFPGFELQGQPPGTESDIYRVKITLAK